MNHKLQPGQIYISNKTSWGNYEVITCITAYWSNRLEQKLFFDTQQFEIDRTVLLRDFEII